MDTYPKAEISAGWKTHVSPIRDLHVQFDSRSTVYAYDSHPSLASYVW